jgi:hypothetical protein
MLSASEMRAMLARVAEGGGTGVTTELNRLTYPRAQNPVEQAVSCVNFAAKTIKVRTAEAGGRCGGGKATTRGRAALAASCQWAAPTSFGRALILLWTRKSLQATTRRPSANSFVCSSVAARIPTPRIVTKTIRFKASVARSRTLLFWSPK